MNKAPFSQLISCVGLSLYLHRRLYFFIANILGIGNVNLGLIVVTLSQFFIRRCVSNVSGEVARKQLALTPEIYNELLSCQF